MQSGLSEGHQRGDIMYGGHRLNRNMAWTGCHRFDLQVQWIPWLQLNAWINGYQHDLSSKSKDVTQPEKFGGGDVFAQSANSLLDRTLPLCTIAAKADTVTWSSTMHQVPHQCDAIYPLSCRVGKREELHTIDITLLHIEYRGAILKCFLA